MVSKLKLFSIYSFLHVLLDPHKKIHIGEELTKIVFLLFECGIILYMLTHVFKCYWDQKPIHLMIILENNEWFSLLQVELEIKSLL